MSALADDVPGALLGSTILLLVVLAVRGPARRWVGPRSSYALWAFPVLRLVIPPLPTGLLTVLPATAGVGTTLTVLIIGPATSLWHDPSVGAWQTGTLIIVAWFAGAAALLGLHVVRHMRFRRRLLTSATDFGRRGSIHIVGAAVDGPLACGVFHRIVAVPLDFAERYSPREQELALAHECAHHARGDLVANWVSLAVLAAHWWNPVAWAAIAAFRDDQEFAVDATVLAHCDPGARPAYAHVLARASGLGALPVCNLNPRSNLKGRLMMLTQKPLPKSRVILGGGVLTLAAVATLAATIPVASTAAPSTGKQAVTIGVKPDGTGAYALIVGGGAVAPGAPLPGGATLPADFDPAGGCDLKPTAKPHAMVIKGFGATRTYIVMCASAAAAPLRATLGEGLASLSAMRASIATQPASAAFPETERTHALGAVDRSIHEVEGTLAKTG